jgi:heavy metal-binding protein
MDNIEWMVRHLILVVAIAVSTGATSSGVAAPQTVSGGKGASQSTAALPPLSYICPMPGDEDVIEDKPGTCRKCGMELEPVRLDSVWTCPVHAAVQKEQPGKCPIDGRALVPMTMAVTWTCPADKSAKESLTPGKCADGSAMTRKFTARPHGNHNPQHGGAFFMAPDNWHHLEGSYFAPGTFRLYLYDDFTRPLPVAQVRATQARLILTKDGKELPLVRNGRFLEARVGKLPFPAVMQAKVRFKPEEPEHLFDFTFEQFSKDLPAPVATLTAAPAAPPAGADAPPAAAPAPTAAPAVEAAPSAVDSALVPLPVPETVPEMLAQLQTRNDQIKMFIDRGAFASVYVPAFQAKDLALALDDKKKALPPEQQRVVGPAVTEVIKTAYLLDAFGDLGNKQQIVDAYSRFSAAVKRLESAFPRQP